MDCRSRKGATMSHPFLAAFQKALAHIGDYQLKKGDAVWNKTYGIGKFEKTDPLNARLGYVRFEKKSDGKYVQHIGILGLKRQKVFGGKWESVIERQYLPGETVTERAFRDLDTGTATQDMVRAADGYHVLVSIAERVGLGESARDL